MFAAFSQRAHSFASQTGGYGNEEEFESDGENQPLLQPIPTHSGVLHTYAESSVSGHSSGGDENNPSVDSLDALLLSEEADNGKWIFELLDWDEILKTSENHSKYNNTAKDKTVDISLAEAGDETEPRNFHYFRRSLSHCNDDTSSQSSVTSSQQNSKAIGGADDAKDLRIFETLYDRLAQSRLLSIRNIFDELAVEKSDPIYSDFALNAILAPIVEFELNPTTVREMLYKNVVSQFQHRCHPKWYRRLMCVSNWLLYLIFFVIHFFWLRSIWKSFVHTWNTSDDDTSIPATPGAAVRRLLYVAHYELFSGLGDHVAYTKHFSGGPTDIFHTMGAWSSTQWILVSLWAAVMTYMAVLFYISLRIEKFGGFMDRLTATRLFSREKRESAAHEAAMHHFNALVQLQMQQQAQQLHQFHMAGAMADPGTAIMQPMPMPMPGFDNTATMGITAGDIEALTDDEYTSEETDSASDNTCFDTPNGEMVAATVENEDNLAMMLEKLRRRVNSIYFHREHLLLYSVISMVKMFLMGIYLSCLVVHALVPNTNWWLLWPSPMMALTLYVGCCTIGSFWKGRVHPFLRPQLARLFPMCCARQDIASDDESSDLDVTTTPQPQDVNQDADNANNAHVPHPALISALTDGLWNNEWVVTFTNVSLLTVMLTISCGAIAEYIGDYDAFTNNRYAYLQALSAVHLVWIVAQLVMWKLRFYGTIFFLMLAVPSLLIASASYYVVYEFFVLSVMHLFLGIVFALGEFHLIGSYDDPATLDPTDWTLLGALALFAKMFRFRLPEANDDE